LQIALAVGTIGRALTWAAAMVPHHVNVSPIMTELYAQGTAFWLAEFEKRSEELSHG
jgi:hypothetical protein